jgi:hypothetical protein
VLHPFRFKPSLQVPLGDAVLPQKELLEDLVNRLGPNHLDIQGDLKSTGFADIPEAFNWWFHRAGGRRSIADMAKEESKMFQHHLKTEQRIEITG